VSFQYSFCAHFIWSTHHQHIYFNFIWNECLSMALVYGEYPSPFHIWLQLWEGFWLALEDIRNKVCFVVLHFLFFCTLFRRKYSPTLACFLHAFWFIWNTCTFGWLCVYSKFKTLLFMSTFHMKFYFKLTMSHLYFSICTDTTINKDKKAAKDRRG
jgi:hypothetical protein